MNRSFIIYSYRHALLLFASGLLLTGCAASRAYNRGLHAERAQRYTDAIRYYSEAAAKNPEEPTYRLALSGALIKSGDTHVKRGETFEKAEEWDLAYREFCDAYVENPLNDRALLKRDMVRKRLLAEAESPKTPKEPPIPSPLDSLQKSPVTLKMTDAELSDIFTSIERLTGVTFIYDDSFKSRKVNVNFQQMNFREALDRLMLMTRLFYKPVDEHTILIAPDNETKRAEYDEQLLKTFYLHNGDVTKVASNLKSMVDLKRIMINPDLKAITVCDSAEKLEYARRLIEKEDMRRAEVVVDMEILEFNRNRLRQYGLDFSSYAVAGAVALEPVTQLPSGSLIRGHMLDNIELSDILFSIPSVVFRLLRTDTRTRLIARPQLRTADGEKIEIKIGEKVPIPVTTFVPYSGGGVNNQAITSFQMTDIGLRVEVTPTIHYNDEISLKAEFELTSIVREGTVTQPPTIGNRSVSSSIRLRDGETTLIAGLIKTQERHSRSGIPGISQLPVLGHIFASNQDGDDQTDIVLTMTPHIVRIAEIGEEERRAIWMGTAKTMRISEEPPPYVKNSSELPVSSSQPVALSKAEVNTAPAVSASPPAPQTAPGTTNPRPPLGTGNQEPATPPLPLVSFAFDPMDVRVPVGVQFSMRVTTRSSDKFTACSFDLVYDNTRLEVSKVEQGRSIRSGFESQVNGGRVSIKFDAAKDFDGVACRIVFLSKGSGSAQLQIENAKVTDMAGVEFETSVLPMSIQIGSEGEQKSETPSEGQARES